MAQREPAFENRFAGPVRTIVQAGELHVHGQAASPHDFAAGPLLIGRLPGLAAGRQGRDSDETLADALDDGGTAVLCQVVSGMGGVGKTQTAAAYARRCWDQNSVDLLVWASAADRESTVAAFVSAAAQTCGAEGGDDNAAERFLSWLDRPDAPTWLIVLDDLTDPDDLAGLWPPAAQRGRTIITTRRRDAALDGDGRQRIDLGVFTAEQARDYLRKRMGDDSRALEGADRLTEALGRLPLALAQAAAYILDQPGTTCADYADMVEDRKVKLRALRPDRLPDGYPLEVAGCWSISIERADGEEPRGLAGAIMRLASLFDPAGVPVEAFTAEVALATLAALCPEQSELEPREVRASLARLRRLSLLDFDGEAVRVHAMVQRAVRDGLDEDDRAVLVEAGADALEAIWPETENDPLYAASLRSNVDNLTRNDRAAMFYPGAHVVLFLVGKGLGESGRAAEAADYFRQFHAACEALFGPDHPDTLRVRNSAATWRGVRGEIAEASAEFETLLPHMVRVLGPDHSDTLSARNNAASIRGDGGDIARGLAELEELLPDLVRALGHDHPDTLATRSNIAFIRGTAGDATGALAEFEAILADRVLLLASDHPDVLIARTNVASWRGKAGDEVGALAEFEALLPDRIQVFGPDHPGTLLARGNIASLRGRSGDTAGAIAGFEALLPDQIRVLGPDHPHTLRTRRNLEYCRGRADRG